ncbi:hypothetical protein K3888_06955 [Dietzia aurantiaca]|uniref:ABC transporter permease n=1 Tax=Dietzia aurantiaca TaxID=983873 RepID=UPI001E2FD71C|nr:hypothetical protein [Dietzia aurantiaca]MCD2262440.1 hypothetical protein [Dietzia aurantiaca]
MISPLTGTGLLARIALRTGWRPAAAWVIGLAVLFLATGVSIASLYDTPAKLATYSASLGDTMVMLTGRVAGLDTLGGIVMNEFASLVSFGIPIMAIALTVGVTRREEESGRSELMLSARVARLAPVTAALVVVVGNFLLLGLALWAATFALDIDRAGAVLYVASIAATGWVYAAGTAVLAQVFAHSRTVWAVGLAIAGLTLVTRGIGDTRGTALSWASPLGWHTLVRPFGDPSVGPLLLSVAVAGALGALAVWLAGRRDIGEGMIPTGSGPDYASLWRASRTGTAVHQHLGALVGWTIGVVALMGLYGSLMTVVVEAIETNPDLAVFLGGSGAVVDSVVRMLVAFTGFLGGGFVLQTLGGLRGEETSARLEVELAGERTRLSWLAGHAVVAAVGATVVVAAGSLAFAVTTAVALDDPGTFGSIVGAGLWQLPAVLAFAALSVGLFGLAPRLQTLAWVVFVVAVVVTFMGPTLRLTDAQMRFSPFGAVGAPPTGPVDTAGVVVLLAVTAVLVTAGLVGFRRRDVPRT